MAKELTDGLFWWTAKHPEWPGEDAGWGPEVSSYAVFADDVVVLIDPVAPPKEIGAGDQRKRIVLLTCSWHARDAAPLASNGAAVFAPEIVENVPGAEMYGAGDVLPAGIRAVAAGHPDEFALWLPRHRALAVGESLYGEGGAVQLPPADWLPEGATIDEFKTALAPLTSLNPEWLLTAHGPPISGASAALAAAIN